MARSRLSAIRRRPPVVDLATEDLSHRRSRRCSTQNFDDFYRAHVGFAARYARRLGVDDAAIDDVVQQVFLVAYRRFVDVRPQDFPEGSIRAWLFAIVIRVVRDHRRTTRRKSPHLNVPHTDPETIPDSGLGPHDAFARGEAARLVRFLLDGLDREKRDVLVLTELEQLTIAEIAETFGISARTVSSRRKAARRAFKRAVERYFVRETRRLR
jgi:RNA polymerase sigma-70 factor, ECF subfamily